MGMVLQNIALYWMVQVDLGGIFTSFEDFLILIHENSHGEILTSLFSSFDVKLVIEMRVIWDRFAYNYF